jgi:hypothetical protein
MAHPLIDPELRDTFSSALSNLGKVAEGASIACVGVLRGQRGIKVCVDNIGEFYDSDLKKWRGAVSIGGLRASEMDVDFDNGRVTFTLAYKRQLFSLNKSWPILLLSLQVLTLMWMRPERYSPL